MDILKHIDKTNEEECQFKYDKIYNNMGTRMLIWHDKRNLLFNCCNNLERMPKTHAIQY